MFNDGVSINQMKGADITVADMVRDGINRAQLRTGDVEPASLYLSGATTRDVLALGGVDLKEHIMNRSRFVSNDGRGLSNYQMLLRIIEEGGTARELVDGGLGLNGVNKAIRKYNGKPVTPVLGGPPHINELRR